jgi:hypothetical protein
MEALMDEDWWRRCNRWEEEGREEGRKRERGIEGREQYKRKGITGRGDQGQGSGQLSDNRDQESCGLAG